MQPTFTHLLYTRHLFNVKRRIRKRKDTVSIIVEEYRKARALYTGTTIAMRSRIHPSRYGASIANNYG